MEMACPGELPVYQMFPGPLATQQGALVGYGGVGPVIGKTSRALVHDGEAVGTVSRRESQDIVPERGPERGIVGRAGERHGGT